MTCINFSGMVSVIVDKRYMQQPLTSAAVNFEPSVDSTEVSETLNNMLVVDSFVGCDCYRSQDVSNVFLAGQSDFNVQ